MITKFVIATVAVIGLVSEVHAKCLGHVHYMSDGVRMAETFEMTAMTVNKETGEKLYGGHGTSWFAPADIKITGRCEFYHNSPADDKIVEYFSVGAPKKTVKPAAKIQKRDVQECYVLKDGIRATLRGRILQDATTEEEEGEPAHKFI